VKALTPPALYSLARQVRDALFRRNVRPEWEYVPEGWSRTRVDPAIKGWDVEATRDAHQAQWPRWISALQGTGPLGVDFFRPFRPDQRAGEMPREIPWAHNVVMSFAYVLALAADGLDTVSVFDWGGGIGHYFPLAQTLLPTAAISYHCKDVPSLAKLGQELSPDAHFYSDDSVWPGQKYDLVVSCAALHLAENWDDVVHKLAGSTGRYLYLTRIPTVSRTPSFVTVQRAYDYGFETEYLGWFFNRNEFLACAEKAGMELVREFVMMDQLPVKNAPEEAVGRGFLFKPR
jgi:putative methyltransferase (TIGR04325 family)